MQARAISSLRREWRTRSTSAAATALLERLTTAEPDLAALGASSLGELFEALRSPGCRVPRWQIVSALTRQLDQDDLVALGLLSTFVPGLIRVATRLRWGEGGAWESAEAFGHDLVTEAWSSLVQAAAGAQPFPERYVYDRVRWRLRDQIRAAKRHRRREQLAAGYGGGSTAAWPDWEDERSLSVLGMLAIALCRIDASSLPRDDVQLLFAHRVLGYSFAELAEQSGAKAAALKYRSHRAETLLCAG